jgi:hypothetical protein
MQDNRRENSGDELQRNQSTDSSLSPGNDSNKAQQMGQNRPNPEKRSTFELSEIDRQEGNMNHGTVGGNLEEDKSDKTHDQFSPPY